MNHWKLTVGGSVEIEDDQALSIVNVRPENNISSLSVTIGDWQSSNYSDVFDVHSELKLEVKTGGRQTYTTIFDGIIHNLKPVFSDAGEDLEVQAWGFGVCLSKTFCNTSYGVESSNPTLDTPEEILDDIATDYVAKRLGAGGVATEWVINTTDVDAPHADFSVTHLNSPYLDNFTLISRLLDLINAHAVVSGDVGAHWYFDTDKHLRVKEIDADSTDTLWTRYYGGTVLTAVIKEGVDDVEARGFHKQIDDYANHIIVSSAFRKPAHDVWTESTDGWADDDVTLTVDTGGGVGEPAVPAVGTYMLKAASEIDGTCRFYYDFPAPCDFTKVGSQLNPPKLNFLLACNDISDNTQIGVNLYTTRTTHNYHYVDDAAASTLQNMLSKDSEWQFISIPIGEYATKYFDRDMRYSGAAAADTNWHWSKNGANADWNSIAGIEFQFDGTAERDVIFVDDIHFSGNIIRSCYDQSEISATTKERQKFFRMDYAVDDTLVADDDDAGMGAMVALSELFRSKQAPTTGTLRFPMKEDMLPGQTLMVYAGLKADRATFRWSNLPMRIKELTNKITAGEFYSSVQITSDVSNTFAVGVPNMWDLLMDKAGALDHGQAKDLRASGVDNQVAVLSWDPT